LKRIRFIFNASREKEREEERERGVKGAVPEIEIEYDAI